MRFSWDADKAERVFEEHRVDFARVIDIFNDPYAVEYVDEGHSTESEIRYSIIGLTAAYGLVFLSYTEPAEDEIHFITARRAERWMVEEYEENRRRY